MFLQVSTIQMTILMLYNNALTYSVSQIQSQTGIDMNVLIQNLMVLLKGRILKMDEDQSRTAAPASSSAASASAIPSQLTPESQIRLYTEYNK